MEALATLPLWGLALAIFALRVVDVSVGTIRTLSIVEGRTVLAVLLGFVEVLVWITVVAQVIARLSESPVLPLAFAGGFAAGNAIGIWLERKLAFGTAVLRVISGSNGNAIADAFRREGASATTYVGASGNGDVTMIHAVCRRRQAQGLVDQARSLDPSLIFTIDRAGAWFDGTRVVSHPTGWRAFWKMK